MTFTQWLFGGIENPFKAGQWGPLHVGTLVTCAALIVGFYFLVKYARNPEKTKNVIVYALTGAIAFFEVMIRFVHCVKLYHLHLPEMEGITWYWILLPKPWCAVSCWALIASVFIKKPVFNNFAALSALLCSVVFFVYPGVGYNNVYLLFENWYSILTHALLLTTSIAMIVLKQTNFRYETFWKVLLGFALVIVYALVEIYILKIQTDPMYFMPGGDIQADILRVDYGVYLTGYIVVILIYLNVPYLISDRKTVKEFFAKRKGT